MVTSESEIRGAGPLHVYESLNQYELAEVSLGRILIRMYIQPCRTGLASPVAGNIVSSALQNLDSKWEFHNSRHRIVHNYSFSMCMGE
jgi:hypothetical protein